MRTLEPSYIYSANAGDVISVASCVMAVHGSQAGLSNSETAFGIY